MPPTFICWSHCKASALPGVFLPSFFDRLSQTGRYKSILPIHQWWFKHVDGSNLDDYSNMVYSLQKMPMHPVVTGWLIPCPNLWLSPWSFQSAICWGWPKVPAGDRGHERVFDFQPASRTGSRLTQQPGHAVLSAVFLWNVQVQWTTTNKLMPPSIISVSFRYLHYFWWMTSVSRWVSLQLPQLRFKLLPLEDSVTLSMTCCF